MIAPQAHDDDAESAKFQLPLPGLYAALALGHGSVSLPDEFLRAPRAVQLPVIDDWQCALARVQQRLLQTMGCGARD